MNTVTSPAEPDLEITMTERVQDALVGYALAQQDGTAKSQG